MTAPTYLKSTLLALKQQNDSPSMSPMKIRAPPGLELFLEVDSEPEVTVPKPNATRLSLADLCSPQKPKKVTNKINKIEAPPGLEGFAPPPGLEGMESDDTRSGGQRSPETTDDSGQSDGEQSSGLVLLERNHLKASSPMFQPMLSASTAAALPDLQCAVQPMPTRTPLRTKLTSKADVFLPSTATAAANAAAAANGSLPYVPMAAVNESWQKWHMRNSMHGADYYSAQDGAYGDTEYDTADYYYSDADGVSSYENMAEFYPEQEWPYEQACF